MNSTPFWPSKTTRNASTYTSIYDEAVSPSMPRVRTGLDRVLDDEPDLRKLTTLLRGGRVGLVTNDAALDVNFERARTALMSAKIRLTRLFSPEHGINTQGRDGAMRADIIDASTGLPVTSLYGERFTPQAADLDNLDVVVYDLPDVGCRFYTYVWTLTHVMEACAEQGRPLVVLDRPNPLGGMFDVVEGPMLDEHCCSSFLGRWSIPIRHSLTVGELARHWANTRVPDLDLRVAPVAGWAREDLVAGSGRPWVPTSPAIPSAETALLYPGTGLMEGFNMSCGRGTALPFRVVGAPWLDGRALAEELRHRKMPGVAVVPYSFTPMSGADRHAGRMCEGVLITVTEPAAVRPVALGIELILALESLEPDYLREQRYPTAANPDGTDHLDRLLGLREAFDAVRRGIVTREGLECPDWEQTVGEARLYDVS